MTWLTIFGRVTLGALGGMTLGGLFGLASGLLTPSFFRHLIPWNDVEPVGFAVVLGATGGVFLGGGLGVFAVVLSGLLSLRSKRLGNPGEPSGPAPEAAIR
jgi:hypothetical protein